MQCPQCKFMFTDSRTESELIALAKSGELDFYCVHCDLKWPPTPEENRRIVATLRRNLQRKTASAAKTSARPAKSAH